MRHNHMRHNHPSDKKFPKNYTGPIWMKQLIAQLIYYNLNHWQICNEAVTQRNLKKNMAIPENDLNPLSRLFTSCMASQKTPELSTDSLWKTSSQCQTNVSRTGYTHTRHLNPTEHPKTIPYTQIATQTNMHTQHTKHNGKNTFWLPTAHSAPGYSTDILFSKDLLE